jgi:hypothetical protein
METGARLSPADLEARPPVPMPVGRTVMIQWWRTLTFLHWPFDVEDIERLLPPGLVADTFEGRAWDRPWTIGILGRGSGSWSSGGVCTLPLRKDSG